MAAASPGLDDCSGLARAYLFDGRDTPAPFVGYLSYDFTTPQPVPEPATLLLVAGGLTAAFARRWTPRGVSRG
jgi:hypothetical protein